MWGLFLISITGMEMKKICYALTLAMLASGNAWAEESKLVEKSEKKSPWTSAAELGFVKTTGNTADQTSLLKANVVYEVDKWRHTGHLEGYGSQSENDTGVDVVSAERYELSGKSDYKFNEHDYVFGLVKLQKDRFSGFEYEDIVSIGYGRKAIKKENMELDLEIGPGIRFFKVDNGVSEDEALLVLAANYWWAISDTSKFIQELSTEIGENITSTKSVTGIQANINSTLALKFTYTVRHKTRVPVDTEKTDTETAMTLVYTF
jgi:putative salt-induced outer membrane protein